MSNHAYLIVDGHSMAYRAFYAIRDLRTREGVPTNAVFGFIKMLDQLVRHWKPAQSLIVFDGGLPLERMALLPEYKAQRKAMPDELRPQFDLIERYLDAAGIPRYREALQEADDVMATLARQAAQQSGQVLVATNDKDLFQLVDASILLVLPTKMDVPMDADQVRAKTGVLPERIPDWLALVGDTADNIPGVPGVGPKTAAKLLQDFDSIEQLFDRVEEVPKEKLRCALIDHRELVLRNLRMTRLRTDLPVTLPTCSPVRDTAALLRFFKEMEFRSMAQALESPSLFD